LASSEWDPDEGLAGLLIETPLPSRMPLSSTLSESAWRSDRVSGHAIEEDANPRAGYP
jgi:hypothetical protein